MTHLDPNFFFSIWPAFGCIAVALACACLPVFRAADAQARSPGRALGLDGLRGFLALAVVVHHAAIYRAFLLDGVWSGDVPRLYYLAGPVAVSMFFMITAFLFWSRVIRERGQPDWTALLVGRVFRIAPVYLLAIFAMFAYIAVADGGVLKVSPAALLNQALGHMALGLVYAENVNDFPHTSLILAGVTWTLRWEWYFYASLPLTALAARRPGLHLPFTLALLVGTTAWTFAAPSREAGLALLFSVGMACASARAVGFKVRASPSVLSAAALLLIAGVVVILPGEFSVPMTFLLGGAFFLIAVGGSTLFGVLASRAVVRLGEVSFGIYMLHGLCLALVLRTDAARFAAASSPALYWLLVTGVIALTLGCSLLAHVAVERPGIGLGRSFMHHFPRGPLGATYWRGRGRNA